MLAWLAPLVVFGLVVFVHELGHFLAAKAVGVYAPRFSIGFGPSLWRKRWGETEYVLAALPLGGYVRMASREDDAVAFLEGGNEGRPSTATAELGANGVPPSVQTSEGRDDWDPEAMIPFGPKPVPEHRWFESKPLIARLFIMIAGVTMNALLALVVSIGLVAGYGRAYIPAVIDSVVANKPAARAGIQKGDSIAAVDGVPVHEWGDVIEHVGAAAGRAVTLTLVRAGRQVQITVRPESTEVTNGITGRPERVGKIGVAPAPREARTRVSFGTAIAMGWTQTWRMAGSIVLVVKGLFSGGVSVSQLGGPIAIARTSVAAARSGIESLLFLVSFLSINIAILNLLPIPILDGGQIVLNILESAKGSAFSARTRGYILRAGLLAIVLLFVLVMFNDLKGVVESLR